MHVEATPQARRRLLRVRDIEREYGGSRSLWHRLAQSGELPCIRVGRALFVSRDDLETFLRSKRVGR